MGMTFSHHLRGVICTFVGPLSNAPGGASNHSVRVMQCIRTVGRKGSTSSPENFADSAAFCNLTGAPGGHPSWLSKKVPTPWGTFFRTRPMASQMVHCGVRTGWFCGGASDNATRGSKMTRGIGRVVKPASRRFQRHAYLEQRPCVVQARLKRQGSLWLGGPSTARTR